MTQRFSPPPQTPDQILATLTAWAEGEGAATALVTVTETWGSAPRPVGSWLAVHADGRFQGSVSGGCVEGATIREAQAAIADGRPRLISFGVSDDEAWTVGLACGGTIRLRIDPFRPEDPTPSSLARALAERAPLAWERVLPEGPGMLRPAEPLERTRLETSDAAAPRFIQVLEAPPRLWIVGAVHIAQALAPMAEMLGWQTAIIDPRTHWATPERFPDLRLIHDWPDQALAELGLDRRTAVVSLTHDAKFDDPALIAALTGDCLYVGALGSTRTHARRLQRLAEAGITADQAARIHAPIGLDLGALSPAEIALSIMAELTRTLRRGADSRPRRDAA